MRLKDGSVNGAGLDPRILIALIIADQLVTAFGVELVITSLNDGDHSAGSSHFDGRAADVRRREFRGDEVFDFCTAWHRALGGTGHFQNGATTGYPMWLTDVYMILLEPTHIHIQLRRAA